MKLEGKTVLVLGLGASGASAARFCARRGARVVASDERPRSALPKLEDWPSEIELRTGGPFPDPSQFDLTVPSPGVPAERYRGAARRVWGDIELAGRALEIPIVAVTGTNGKSTCVRMIERMSRGCGRRVGAAGNLGTPALSLVGRALDTAVLEVSSFQLETTEQFRPDVAVVLNIAPDHLDRHGDLDGYVRAKRRLVERQTADDVAILNLDDPLVWSFAESTPARVIPFSLTPPPDRYAEAAWLDANALLLRSEGGVQRFALDSLPLEGRHECCDAAAALLACHALGAPAAEAVRSLIHFRRLPHRRERVARHRGIEWIDDSKATNVAAALSALESVGRPLVWIAGGRDKGLDFSPLARAAAKRVRHALLIGEAAERLERSLAPAVECEHLPDLRRAVARANELAREGDAVLLAPACSSFDQFRSFEERGECFRRAVEDRIAEESGQ